VDVKAGTTDFLIDGVHLLKFGRQSAERAPGLGAQLSISSYAYNGSVVMLSNISVRPWNGDLPRPNEGPGTISLTNGDFTTGEIGSLDAGALTIGSDAEAIRVPLERITAVDFGAVPILEKAAARVRLLDGTVAHLKTFRWENEELAAESHNFGPIRVPRASIRELVLSPTPVRFPKLAEPKKLATKGAAEPKEVAP